MDKQEYLKLREDIAERNANLVGIILNEKEKKLDNLLNEYKTQLENMYEQVPYNMPLLKDEKLSNNNLYTFCQKLPKGSDLHVHGTSLLPMPKLIEFVKNHNQLLFCPEDYILYLENNKPNNKETMPLKKALDYNIITYEELLKKWTILEVKHNEDPWAYFEYLFNYFASIDLDFDILYDYYLEAFSYYFDLGIYHIEVHLLLPEDYDECLKTIKTIKKAYFEVKKKHDEFTVSIIGSGMKLCEYSMDYAKGRLNDCQKLMCEIKDDFNENIHDFILGFDLINEEDISRQLVEYAPMLIEFKKEHPDFQYFLHSGESLDYRSNNLIDAYLIDAKRVGHGLNLYRYPQLLKSYADKEICLEICPISNQALRYVRDLRIHPAAEYLRRGVTISLASDDPIFFEKEALCDDFFASIVCWNLGVAEIKQLCINSILYSGLDKINKRKLLNDWKSAWEKFVDSYIN